MKKMLMALLGLTILSNAFAGSANEEYNFTMRVDHLALGLGNSCSLAMQEQLDKDIKAENQILQLDGSYDLKRSYGGYSVSNFQDNSYFLGPLGTGTSPLQFASFNKPYKAILINSHQYSLYAVTLDIPSEESCQLNQENWGNCGELSLHIVDPSIENGGCTLSSTPTT